MRKIQVRKNEERIERIRYCNPGIKISSNPRGVAAVNIFFDFPAITVKIDTMGVDGSLKRKELQIPGEIVIATEEKDAKVSWVIDLPKIDADGGAELEIHPDGSIYLRRLCAEHHDGLVHFIYHNPATKKFECNHQKSQKFSLVDGNK